MKNTVFALFLSLIALNFACSQNPPASPHTTVDGKDVKISYGQPSKKGRVIFGAEGSQSLEKYGKVWRTGANEATTFTTNKDLTIEGKTLPAGKYTLWTIPREDKWTVIFNNKMYDWGVSFGGDASREESADVLQVDVPVNISSIPVEKFEISFDENQPALVLEWDITKVVVPFK